MAGAVSAGTMGVAVGVAGVAGVAGVGAGVLPKLLLTAATIGNGPNPAPGTDMPDPPSPEGPGVDGSGAAPELNSAHRGHLRFVSTRTTVFSVGSLTQMHEKRHTHMSHLSTMTAFSLASRENIKYRTLHVAYVHSLLCLAS